MTHAADEYMLAVAWTALCVTRMDNDEVNKWQDEMPTKYVAAFASIAETEPARQALQRQRLRTIEMIVPASVIIDPFNPFAAMKTITLPRISPPASTTSNAEMIPSVPGSRASVPSEPDKSVSPSKDYGNFSTSKFSTSATFTVGLFCATSANS